MTNLLTTSAHTYESSLYNNVVKCKFERTSVCYDIMIYEYFKTNSDKPFSALCHANAEHNKANVFPDPVGLSKRQFCCFWQPRITCKKFKLIKDMF